MKQKKTGTSRTPSPKISKKSLLKYGGVALSLLLFVLAVVLLNRPLPDAVATSASLRTFVPARIVAVTSDNAAPDQWTEGLRIGTQQVQLKLLEGAYRGRILPADNYLNAYANVDVKVGTRVIVRLDLDEANSPYVVAITSYDRGPVLGGMVLLFALLLIVIGGKKGIMALLGLVFTLVALWFMLIPLIMRGVSPIPATILLVILTTAASLLLLNGFSKKTLCATLGCVGGVTVAGLAAALVGVLTPIGGFSMPEAEELVLRATEQGMTIRGLLVCGVLIAALGAVMDVAMAIASALFEVHTLNPKLTRAALFRSGMNIGKDAMGTMANTLILAFAGSSLNMLILFRVFDYPYLQIFNSDLMAVEIIQGIAGSMGIVLTVPLVAFISAAILSRPVRKAND